MVRWLGVQTGAEKSDSFTRSDIFCFPSHFESEAFPVVLIEAMRSGLPVVSTRWRGIPDLVEDGKTGYLIDVRDPDALADRVASLCIDPGLRKQLVLMVLL